MVGLGYSSVRWEGRLALSPRLEHSFLILDRWLLETLERHGAQTAEEIANSDEARVAGDRHGKPSLSGAAVQKWLESARVRGLLQRYDPGLDGSAIQPPQWGLSDRGRERLTMTRAQTRFVPGWLGNTLLPLLSTGGKALLGLASVFLAARATRVIHSGTGAAAISPTAAQVAIGVVVAIGVLVYLVIRHTDNHAARREAVAAIERELS
jgi:hypothetical protein